MSYTDKCPIIEFHRKKFPGHPENVIKIDGKEIKGIRNIKIEYGLDEPMPVVTLEFLATEIKGEVEGIISTRSYQIIKEGKA